MAIKAGDRAPEYALTDLGGERRSLRDALARGPVLAVFLKTSCGSCKTAFPYVEKLFQAHTPRLTVWGVSQDDAGKTSRFAQRYGCTFPFLLDDDGWAVSQAYDPTGVPAFYLIGADGAVLLHGEGFSRVEMSRLSDAVAAAERRPGLDLFPPDDPAPAFRPACESKHRLVAAGLLEGE